MEIIKIIIIVLLTMFVIGAMIKIKISIDNVKRVYILNKDDQYKIKDKLKSKFMTFKVYEPDEDLNTKIFLSSAKYIKFENGQIIFSDMADEDILNIMTMISNYNFLLLYLGLSDEKKKQFMEKDNKVTDWVWNHAQEIIMNTTDFKNLISEIYSEAFDKEINDKLNLEIKLK